MKAIGTAACPPYHLAVVIGGTSAELVLKTVKLASARYLDGLPTAGGPGGHAFRDLELEALLLEASRKIGLGAQFGGKYFCLDVRVVRLPRHGASCPIGMGVSCNADRNIKGRITRDGILLERLEKDPAKYLPGPSAGGETAVRIDLNRPMSEIRAELSKHPVATRAMQAEGKGEVVSTPRVITANQKEALIEQGVEIPYQEASSSGATSVSFKKAVLSLRVTPQITPDDRVIMDLKVNKDNVGSIYAGIPSIDTREINTQVLVQNGETVVLGGVYEQAKNDLTTKVPFFGDLPLIGWMFRSTSKTDDEEELLIFITPKIVKEGMDLQ